MEKSVNIFQQWSALFMTVNFDEIQLRLDKKF